MNFIETPLEGAYIIEPQRFEDERGFFARSWCKREFETHGLNSRLVQCNISYNRRKGTLRGMHHQEQPYAETKLVRCTLGAVYDVLIDLRPDSPSYKKWCSIKLTVDNRRMVYIPEGFGHGFMTLADNTELFYQMSEFYAPDSARGIRWNDSAFNIVWPGDVTVISEKDKNYPDFMG